MQTKQLQFKGNKQADKIRRTLEVYYLISQLTSKCLINKQEA